MLEMLGTQTTAMVRLPYNNMVNYQKLIVHIRMLVSECFIEPSEFVMWYAPNKTPICWKVYDNPQKIKQQWVLS